MHRCILLILLLFSLPSFSQEKQILKGGIFSQSTDEPLPYSSIHLIPSKTGTISDEEGKFELQFDPKALNDTVIVSSVGYKQYKTPLSKINLKNFCRIELEDSLFLLSEVVAMCYDNIEALKWRSSKNEQSIYLLSFSTRELQNAANYLSILKEKFGADAKIKSNFIRWKKVKLTGIQEKVDFTISWFRCPYCPEPENIAVTIDVKDRKNNNLVDNLSLRKPLIDFFQNLLDKTFAQGADNSQLEQREKLIYLKKAEEPYTGQCYGYYKTGQKGMKGAYVNGVKNGTWEFWFSNNQKKVEGNYDMGKKTGKWSYWYPNGQLRIVANYVDDEMDGKNYWYFENGQIKKEALFRNGVYLEKTEWDEKGNIINVTNFLR